MFIFTYHIKTTHRHRKKKNVFDSSLTIYSSVYCILATHSHSRKVVKFQTKVPKMKIFFIRLSCIRTILHILNIALDYMGEKSQLHKITISLPCVYSIIFFFFFLRLVYILLPVKTQKKPTKTASAL